VNDRPPPSPEVRPPISIDALVFALLCAAYLPMRFIIPAPPVIPGSAPATVLLIAGVMGYFALDLIGARSDRARRWMLRLKWLLVVCAISWITLAPLVMNILARQQSAPYLHAHDGLIQTEAAVQFVLTGKNPYAENYHQTPLALAPFDVKGLTVNPNAWRCTAGMPRNSWPKGAPTAAIVRRKNWRKNASAFWPKEFLPNTTAAVGI